MRQNYSYNSIIAVSIIAEIFTFEGHGVVPRKFWQKNFLNIFPTFGLADKQTWGRTENKRETENSDPLGSLLQKFLVIFHAIWGRFVPRFRIWPSKFRIWSNFFQKSEMLKSPKSVFFGHNCLWTTRNRLVSTYDQFYNLFVTIKKFHYQYNGDDCLNFWQKMSKSTKNRCFSAIICWVPPAIFDIWSSFCA